MGISANFQKKIEVFLGAVPALGFDFTTVTIGDNSSSDFDFPEFDIGLEIGLRLWLQ